MFHDILLGHFTTVGCEIIASCITISNCADADLIEFIEFMVNPCDAAKGETYATAKKLGQELFDKCRGTAIQRW